MTDGWTIHCGPEADEAMLASLTSLCGLSMAVTIKATDGSERGAVLISASVDGLVIEEWDQLHAPSGNLTTLPLDAIAEVRVT